MQPRLWSAPGSSRTRDTKSPVLIPFSIRKCERILPRYSNSDTLPVMADYSCLIVEDSPMMRQLLVFALARVKNLRVTEADDGVDGLRKLASARYDIIVTDINKIGRASCRER